MSFTVGASKEEVLRFDEEKEARWEHLLGFDKKDNKRRNSLDLMYILNLKTNEDQARI